MSYANDFIKQYTGKLIFDVENYEYIVGIGYAFTTQEKKDKREQLCEYEIKFNDGSSCLIIANNAQYNGLRRSYKWERVKTIGGRGHRKKKPNIQLYFHNIQAHEPFIKLEISACKLVDNNVERCNTTDENISFYSVYGVSAADDLPYCLADCSTLKLTEQLADTFDIFARYTLDIKTIKI